MTLICFTSQKGSPGSTATALAVAAAMKVSDGRQKLLIEADSTGGTLAIRYRLPVEPGLLTLAAAVRSGIEAEGLWAHSQELPGGLQVIVCPDGPEQVHAAMAASGAALGRFLNQLPHVHVICDVGRLAPESPALAFVAEASAVLMVARPTAEQLQPAARRMLSLQNQVRNVGWVLIGEKPYGPDEVESTYNFPVVGLMADDPKSVTSLEQGLMSKKIRRSPFVRSSVTLARTLSDWLAPITGPATQSARDDAVEPTQPEPVGPAPGPPPPAGAGPGQTPAPAVADHDMAVSETGLPPAPSRPEFDPDVSSHPPSVAVDAVNSIDSVDSAVSPVPPRPEFDPDASSPPPPVAAEPPSSIAPPPAPIVEPEQVAAVEPAGPVEQKEPRSRFRRRSSNKEPAAEVDNPPAPGPEPGVPVPDLSVSGAPVPDSSVPDMSVPDLSVPDDGPTLPPGYDQWPAPDIEPAKVVPPPRKLAPARPRSLPPVSQPGSVPKNGNHPEELEQPPQPPPQPAQDDHAWPDPAQASAEVDQGEEPQPDLAEWPAGPAQSSPAGASYDVWSDESDEWDGSEFTTTADLHTVFERENQRVVPSAPASNGSTGRAAPPLPPLPPPSARQVRGEEPDRPRSAFPHEEPENGEYS